MRPDAVVHGAPPAGASFSITQKETNMPKVNRISRQARAAQVNAGIHQHLLSTPSIPLGGSTYSPADLMKLVQSSIDSAKTTDAAKANWHSTVFAEQTLEAQLAPLLRELRQYVISVFGATSPVLADFGFTPPKRATRTPEEKAATAAKAKATRAARHTAGKKQKKAVKGNVTGVVMVPITATPAPQPVATSQAAAPAAVPAPLPPATNPVR
jgi:hypothetical protein